MGRGELPNAKIFKRTSINVGGYVPTRHGSWQHQLPKHCVNVLCPKRMYFGLWADHQCPRSRNATSTVSS